MMWKRNSLLFYFLLVLSFCSQPQRQPEEVRIRLSVDPENLNPVSYTNAQGLQVLNLLFQSLLGADLADTELKPILAESLPVIQLKDSLTYITYTIREEAEWTNGSPVTSDDVAFTLKVLKAPLLNNERLKPQIDFIREIIIDSLYKRKFTFVCQGFSPEMEILSGDFFILPASVFDPKGLLLSIPLTFAPESLSKLENNKQLQAFANDFNSAAFARDKQFLTGSGGYELESWVAGQHLVLKRKENWWGKNSGSAASYLTANPAKINFQIIPDNTTALLALKSKQIDVLQNIATAEFDQLKQDERFLQDYNLYTPDIFEFVYTALNSRLPKFSDKRTRQAIAYLLDTENFIKVTHRNYATPTVGPVPPSIKAYYHTELKPYSLHEEKAIELLKAAGWIRSSEGWHKNINGHKQHLSIQIIYRAGNTVFENSALIFQQSAAKAGIPVSLQSLESSVLSQKIKSHQFEMFFRSIQGNPFIFNFKPLLHTSFAGLGGMNYSGFGTPESDQILDAVLKVESTSEKAKMIRRLQEIVHEEAAFIPLYYQKDKLAIHKRFENTKVSGLAPNYDVSAFTLK